MTAPVAEEHLRAGLEHTGTCQPFAHHQQGHDRQQRGVGETGQ